MLLQGKSVCAQVDTSVIYPAVQDNPASVYSFLLVSGYLKVVKKHLVDGEYMCEMAIPNKELFSVYEYGVAFCGKKVEVVTEIEKKSD